MQYVSVAFRPGGRTYTYYNDGAPVAVGDMVKIEGRPGEGWQALEVLSVTNKEPSFPTKPIMGRVD